MKKLLGILAFIGVSFIPPDTVNSRFNLCTGCRAVSAPAGSFGDWLGKLPLKPKGTKTLNYKGNVAGTDAYTAAVVDVSVGTQDLQQCADAVIRLRSEYLYQHKQYNKISFNFTNGFRCDYQHYANGYRFQQNRWVMKAAKDYSYKSFLQYLKLVFAYAGTISLEKELIKVNTVEVRAGDVFINGGTPGHCFIVLKVCANSTQERKFLLAQSFMPAQSIQVLRAGSNPWFDLAKTPKIPYGNLVTKQYLRRFKD